MKTRLVILCLLLVVTAGAQEHNMARLTQSDTSYVDVSMGLSGETGRLKDVYEPDKLVAGTLDARSRRKLGRVNLFGHFGYGYSYATGSTWRGWIDPYETPFMLADSIAGNLSMERYRLQAGAGVPLAGGWSAGLDLAYDVALMAKHKDLRNKNTGMTFRVAPGIFWQGSHVGVGLDAGYEYGTEKVEYLQVSENLEHVLFDLYGVWLYRASGFGSAETRRLKTSGRVFADFQLGFQWGETSVHNNFRGEFGRNAQTETGYNNLRHGDVRSLAWSDELSVEIGDSHQIELSGEFSTMQGFRPLQQQELDPDSRIRIWVTYGDPVFCYYRRTHREQFDYTYKSAQDWELALGVENEGMMHAYTEYPRRFAQQFSSVTPYLGGKIPVGRAGSLTARIGYAHSYGTENNVSEWQLAEPLLEQWDYWDGDSVLVGIAAAWRKDRMYVQARYDIVVSASAADNDGTRQVAGLTVGFIF